MHRRLCALVRTHSGDHYDVGRGDTHFVHPAPVLDARSGRLWASAPLRSRVDSRLARYQFPLLFFARRGYIRFLTARRSARHLGDNLYVAQLFSREYVFEVVVMVAWLSVS